MGFIHHSLELKIGNHYFCIESLKPEIKKNSAALSLYKTAEFLIKPKYEGYLLFDALIGLSFCFLTTSTVLTWVATLQIPFFHFNDGSGAAVQYMPVSICEAL
jgi:hypothetical protein